MYYLFFSPFAGMPTTQPVDKASPSPYECTFMTMDPFQLVTTPYCNMTLGYLCTQGKKKNLHMTIFTFTKKNPTPQAWWYVRQG